MAGRIVSKMAGESMAELLQNQTKRSGGMLKPSVRPPRSGGAQMDARFGPISGQGVRPSLPAKPQGPRPLPPMPSRMQNARTTHEIRDKGLLSAFTKTVAEHTTGLPAAGLDAVSHFTETVAEHTTGLPAAGLNAISDATHQVPLKVGAGGKLSHMEQQASDFGDKQEKLAEMSMRNTLKSAELAEAMSFASALATVGNKGAENISKAAGGG